ncbi:invasion associated locus B family protein, partial [Candidatus Pelagibacter bacterium]|nr:invasion associated locus B family protein [Candidatus Pelagibacter bacterium]
GCVISITNNTPQTEANELFDEVIKKFINSNELEVAIQGFTGNPIVIKTSLKGFSKGLTQLQKKSKFN